MADIPVISGNFPDGTPFAFTLNGAATQRQMERLIELTSILAKRVTNPKKDPEQLAQIEALKANTTEVNKSTKATKASTEETINFQDALLNLSTVSNIARGNLASAFNGISTKSAAVAVAMGGMVGQLFDYSGQLGQAMQRGVAGGVMDFAIAAKTGGLTLGQFSKALEESGGSFAMLGNGATDGAKQFGSLVSEVRYATASVGNLGLNNEQLATLTAQQVKVAVAQGFKGRSANAQVIENTKAFSEELDNLANRTGKSVLELAAAAQKLALDPVVSNFVATARSGSKAISQAINSYAANLEGLFGKVGEQLRTDALQNALAGLPLSMTEAGKNLQIASSSVFGELQNQANRAAAGQAVSEEDTARLRALVLREVSARRQELTVMSQIKGTAGDAAKQLLALAAEARNYNPEEAAKRRKEDESAKAFVASTNQLRANLQQLAIPILNLLNGVNWTLLTDILRGFTTVLELAMTPLSILGKILSNTGLGSVVGGLLGIATVASMVMAGFTLLKKSLIALSASISKQAASIGIVGSGARRAGMDVPDIAGSKTEKPRYKMDTKTGKPVLIEPTITDTGNKVGKSANTALLVTGLVTSMLGGALSMVGDSKLAEDADSTLGKVASISGKILEWSGTILAVLPGITSLISAMPAIKLAVLGFSSLIKTKVAVAAVSLLGSFSALNLGLMKTAAALTLVSAAPGGGTVAKILGILGNAVAGVSTFMSKIPGVFGNAVAGVSTFMSKIPGVFGNAVAGVSTFMSKIPAMFSGLQSSLSMITGFLSKQLMTALTAFRSGLLAGKAGDALGGLGGIGGKMSGIGKHLGKIGGVAALGLTAYQLSDIESQRQSGAVSDKQATVESATTVGAAGGGMAGAAMGAGFGAAFGGIGAIPGALIGGILGSVLGGGAANVAADLFTSDGTSSVKKELTDTQTSAIDSNNMRESENTKQLAQLNKNMETLVASTDANLMVNGKIASISDNNSRYLRGATFGSA